MSQSPALSDQLPSHDVGPADATPSGAETSAALLDGLRVVELATVVMAPSACAISPTSAAEIIKIEAPGRGDVYRYFQDLPGMPDSEIPYCFLLDDRNKKSVVIDLKQESGQAVAHRLIETADVFLTNCHNSVLDALGMNWERLRKVNPAPRLRPRHRLRPHRARGREARLRPGLLLTRSGSSRRSRRSKVTSGRSAAAPAITRPV